MVPEVAPVSGTPGRIFSDETRDITVLNALNLSLDLTVAELLAEASDAENVHLPIELQDGDLEIGPFSLEVNGGSATGTLSLTQNGDLAALTIAVEGEQLRMSNPEVDESARDQPPLDIALDIRASGSTPHEIAASADGQITVVQGAGRSSRDALGFLANDFLSEIFTALNPFAEKDPFTEFECGVLRVDLEQGEATLSPMLMRTGKIVIAGDGEIDLETEDLSVTFNTKPREGVGLAAAGLVTPFMTITGTLAAPRMGVSTSGVIVEGGLAVATAGVSLFAKELLDRVTANSADCAQVLAEADEESAAGSD
jgi:uncharacterized protein involved in outer membrane biogenesis